MDTIYWALGISGFTVIGGAFLIKTVLKSGIEKAIKHNFAKPLETYKSELSKELESVKSSLKKSEVFFEHKLEALKTLRQINRSLTPRYNYPVDDWDDVIADIALSLSEHTETLKNYMCEFETFIPKNIRNQIDETIIITEEGSFEVDPKGGIPEAISRGRECAELLVNNLQEVTDDFQKEINSEIC